MATEEQKIVPPGRRVIQITVDPPLLAGQNPRQEMRIEGVSGWLEVIAILNDNLGVAIKRMAEEQMQAMQAMQQHAGIAYPPGYKPN